MAAIGEWRNGSTFHLFPGEELADGEGPCPYCSGRVKLDDWDDGEQGDVWAQGKCSSCELSVDFDYNPLSVVVYTT